MSPRNFARAFRREVGVTPAAYVETARVETARVALDQTFHNAENGFLIGGGVVIKVGGETFAAIGASGAPGGDLNEACAGAGLDKIRDKLE